MKLLIDGDVRVSEQVCSIRLLAPEEWRCKTKPLLVMTLSDDQELVLEIRSCKEIRNFFMDFIGWEVFDSIPKAYSLEVLKNLRNSSIYAAKVAFEIAKQVSRGYLKTCRCCRKSEFFDTSCPSCKGTGWVSTNPRGPDDGSAVETD